MKKPGGEISRPGLRDLLCLPWPQLFFSLSRSWISRATWLRNRGFAGLRRPVRFGDRGDRRLLSNRSDRLHFRRRLDRRRLADVRLGLSLAHVRELLFLMLKHVYPFSRWVSYMDASDRPGNALSFP